MTDPGSDHERRIEALELLVAFAFASQHMQTPDPAAALARLRTMLLDSGDPSPAGLADDAELRRTIARVVARVELLQEGLPRRLVD